MEGGIAIFLLVVIMLVVGAIALSLSGTGGFLWWRKTDPRGDRAESGAEERDERRPRHVAPTTPAQEHTDFAGTRDRERRR